jgi:alpha-methylacyl-CoA racemase
MCQLVAHGWLSYVKSKRLVNMMRPLEGIRILDFSTLLPGPLASLILAEAGAEVIKIERPGKGDEMRTYTPKFGDDSVNFALLNRGKHSIAIDLKSAHAKQQLTPLIREADIVLEQYRPGVMQRLGLGYEDLSAINDKLIYCAITGYGQSGPRAAAASHDLNYVAESGMLSLSIGQDGAPILPPALIADIAGGTYPAVVNILLALRQRDRTGKGCQLDIAMADNLFTFMYWAMGQGQIDAQWPKPGGELVTGGSPRYQIYRTKDQRFIAAAPIEEKFWEQFLSAIKAPAALLADADHPEAVKAQVQAIIATETAAYWENCFAGKDVCCSVVASLAEAMESPHFKSRGIFSKQLIKDGKKIRALPVPIDAQFRNTATDESYPSLGQSNHVFGVL